MTAARVAMAGPGKRGIRSCAPAHRPRSRWHALKAADLLQHDPTRRPSRDFLLGDLMPMTRSELARRIHSASHLTGEFVLRSGRTATEYFDKYRFEADPVLLDAIAEQMAVLVPTDVEVLAGLEMGGIPVVTALGRHTGLPCAFVRKQAKSYGTARLAEGADVVGRRVLVVEDVVTSGGQIVLSTGDLRVLGADVR